MIAVSHPSKSHIERKLTFVDLHDTLDTRYSVSYLPLFSSRGLTTASFSHPGLTWSLFLLCGSTCAWRHERVWENERATQARLDKAALHEEGTHAKRLRSSSLQCWRHVGAGRSIVNVSPLSFSSITIENVTREDREYSTGDLIPIMYSGVNKDYFFIPPSWNS